MLRSLFDCSRSLRLLSLASFALLASPTWADQGAPPAAVPAANAAAPAEAEASPSDRPVEASPLDLPPAAAPAVPPTSVPACPKVCSAFRVRPQDQLWAVSTRHLGFGCLASQDPAWKIWRYDGRVWQPATATEFYAGDSPDAATAFYVHGNRVDHWQAFQDGQNVYFQMAGKFDDERPVRFVIWSWPSSQIKGPLKDVRSKAWRTEVEGYYLARFLAPIQPEVQVGLIGYSYGARIITGGIHLLGGGVLSGRTVPAGERAQFRVALWAAAVHNHWLVPGHYHGQALPVAERWLITYNCCDPVLSRYKWLDKCGDPVALGYSGLYGRRLLAADLNYRVEEMNVSCFVGGTHDRDSYLYSLPIQNRTRQFVLWHDLETPPGAPAPQALSAAGK